MTRSYLQVLKQIDELKAQAEKLRRAEVDGVVKRIREAISHYSLSAADLGLGAGGAPKAARKKPGRKPGRPKKVFGKRTVAPKFRDENGNTWAGRGKRPIWLRDALLAGKKLEDFAVNK
jgi:DNA-binding protein H-NS